MPILDELKKKANGKADSANNIAEAIAQMDFSEGDVTPEEIAESVSAYLDEHLTNPTNPPIDTSLTIAGAAADSKETGDKITQLKEELNEYVYKLVPYDRQLFDVNSMIPSAPLRIVTNSSNTFVQIDAYRTYYVEVNGSAGDSYSFNFIGITKSQANINALKLVATNNLPAVEVVAVNNGNVSLDNMRGVITLTHPARYICISMGSTLSGATTITDSCNATMGYCVIRKGANYDTTYYAYDEYPQYQFDSEIENVINETVPSWSLSSTKPTYTPDEINAVAKEQGSENYGKILAVGSDGKVYLVDTAESVDLANALKLINSTIIYAGDNLLLNDASTVGTGWTGSLNNGYVHSSGSNNLVFTGISLENNAKYVVTFNATGVNDTRLYVSLDNNEMVDVYNDGTYFVIGFTSDGTGTLTFKPTANYSGTITNITVQKVNGGNNEIVPPLGKIITFGLTNNLSGFWDVAISSNGLQKNINGTRNVAVGESALKELVTGNRNIALGTFALAQLAHGDRNVAIGADALYVEDAVNDAVAIGYATLRTNGGESVAVGNLAVNNGDPSATGIVAIGYMAGYYAHENNTFIGHQAGYYTKGTGNTAIGKSAGNTTYVTGNNNVCIGRNASFDGTGASSENVKTIDNAIVIGNNAKADASNEIVIGTSDHNKLVIAGKTIVFNDDGTITWS